MYIVLTRSFPPEVGGMQNLMWGLANSLSKHYMIKVFADYHEQHNNYDESVSFTIQRVGGIKLLRKYRKAYLVNEFIKKNNLKEDYDFLVVDFHGEITSEKMAMGYFFDGKATLVVGTHTHVPTSDTMILEKGTAYQTDAGMCGDYNSVIGMNKENSLNRFMKKKPVYIAGNNKNFPADGEASLCGLIVECDVETGLANSINQFIYGGELKNSQQ